MLLWPLAGALIRSSAARLLKALAASDDKARRLGGASSSILPSHVDRGLVRRVRLAEGARVGSRAREVLGLVRHAVAAVAVIVRGAMERREAAAAVALEHGERGAVDVAAVAVSGRRPDARATAWARARRAGRSRCGRGGCGGGALNSAADEQLVALAAAVGRHRAERALLGDGHIALGERASVAVAVAAVAIVAALTLAPQGREAERGDLVGQVVGSVDRVTALSRTSLSAEQWRTTRLLSQPSL